MKNIDPDDISSVHIYDPKVFGNFLASYKMDYFSNMM